MKLKNAPAPSFPCRAGSARVGADFPLRHVGELVAVQCGREALPRGELAWRNRRERESYENIVELYVRIAEQLETMIDG